MAGQLKNILIASAVLSSLAATPVVAITFQNDTGTLTGDFTTLLGTGFGMRVSGIDTSPEFAASGFAVSGDKNYSKDHLFSLYVKVTPEFSFALPEQGISFLARATIQHDFAADWTNSPLSQPARNQLVNNPQLLDLWVSKSFNINGQTGRVRIGNQVINWGETLYAGGGINSINAYDYQKYAIPGTLLKEVLLPAPMVSVAGGILPGLRVETYYQVAWNADKFAPAGGYFSTSDTFGNGSGWNQIKPSNSGQFGFSGHYKPVGSGVDFGFYYLHYNDKAPVYQTDGTPNGSYRYLENRSLYGVSSNGAVGDWALGWEASYRPRDAVGLGGCYTSPQSTYNPSGPFADTSVCPYSIDARKIQTSVSAVLGMTPSDYPFLVKHVLHANNAQLSLEAVMVHYNIGAGTVSRNLNGAQVYQPVLAGGYFFQDSSGNLVSTANKYSGSLNVDFNWSYDGNVIPGWLFTPDIFYSYQLGDNPSALAGALAGNQATTISLFFVQNASKNVITAGLSYTNYFGGKNRHLTRQYYRDRDFVGGYLNVTF
ncbi:uncharacterized protein DUF1302 [Paraburkholderia sp. BL18I3N2]|uniref:DUF1302 domain-containing protein n=1 Tax=unclassified Paraburkholderia TaxID=2615204 RepID=UPI000D071AE4|nr:MULTISPECIES: DUF1302 family protein [unclassified Paraburkholderia]PRX19206.1 uncharacterized protein DUF1302 [Paraburkholderia sp. BL18I3N2]PRX89412.1 uncharacterized protein DUF1302 [Paraburkholderia sp. BL25I1N1]